jgi:hypothetical protein
MMVRLDARITGAVHASTCNSAVAGQFTVVKTRIRPYLYGSLRYTVRSQPYRKRSLWGVVRYGTVTV